MAADPFVVYAPAMEALFRAQIDLDNDAFRAVLLTNAYTPNANAHATFADVSDFQVANGAGYATHGILVSPLTLARVDATVTVSASVNPAWAASPAITARYLVLVRDANADGVLAPTDLLLGFVNLETTGPVTARNDDLRVTLTGGLFPLTRTVGG